MACAATNVPPINRELRGCSYKQDAAVSGTFSEPITFMSKRLIASASMEPNRSPRSILAARLELRFGQLEADRVEILRLCFLLDAITGIWRQPLEAIGFDLRRLAGQNTLQGPPDQFRKMSLRSKPDFRSPRGLGS